MINGIPKADIDSYFVQAKLHIKALIEDQLKKMQSTNIVMTLWVKQKNSVKSGLTLDTRDFEYVQDIRNKTDDNYTKVEIPFNSMMKEFFEASNIEELIQRMFAHIRRQVENPCIYEISFVLDQIMHLHINFYKLALVLTEGRS